MNTTANITIVKDITANLFDKLLAVLLVTFVAIAFAVTLARAAYNAPKTIQAEKTSVTTETMLMERDSSWTRPW